MNTQMNVRIDGDLKAQGDAVFAKTGLTPSDVVRAVWTYAVEHQEAPAIVKQALDSPQQSELSLKSAYAQKMLDEASTIVERFCLEQGIELLPETDEFDYKAMRETMYEEMLEEQGI